MLAIFTKETPDGYREIVRFPVPPSMPTGEISALLDVLDADYVQFTTVNSENEPIER